MRERESSFDGHLIDGVYVSQEPGLNIIQGIPSDAHKNIENGLSMQIVFGLGGVFIGMNGITDANRGYDSFISMPSMRFKSFAKRGYNPVITYYLSELVSDFIIFEGQMPPESRLKNVGPSGFFPLHGTEVTVSKEPDKPWIDIRGIGDEVDSHGLKAIDLQVWHNKNVSVTMSNVEHNIQATMEFRTAENGGKFPSVANAFMRIGKSMAGIT